MFLSPHNQQQHPLCTQRKNKIGGADYADQKDLIQLGKTKLLNILNDDGVCILNVEATLHNIGANKDPDLTLSELLHSFLKLP